MLDGAETDAYVFRPCIVAGPEATLLLDMVPLLALGQRLPGPRPLGAEADTVLRPVLPDPGVRFQLVHHDDVAAALTAATIGVGEPGVYNLAGPGELTISDLAHELGWHAIGVPAAPDARGRGRRRGALPCAVHAAGGDLDRGDPAADADGHDPGAARAATGCRTTTPARPCGETIAAVRARR